MSHYIKVTDETFQEISKILKKINDKKYGRKIRSEDLFVKLISLLNDQHFNELREISLTNKDKLEQAFELYCKTQKNISRDEFIGLLLSEKSSEILNKN